MAAFPYRILVEQSAVEGVAAHGDTPEEAMREGIAAAKLVRGARAPHATPDAVAPVVLFEQRPSEGLEFDAPTAPFPCFDMVGHVEVDPADTREMRMAFEIAKSCFAGARR